MKFVRAGLFAFLSIVACFDVIADTASYTASNTGGPEWDRPIGAGPSISGLGPVRYQVEQFTVSANDTCDIRSVQNYDGYLHLYVDPFEPLDQLNNLVAGDDDGAGGIGTSDIDNQPLVTGTVYQVVTSAFANGEEGDFTNTISCPNAIVTIGATPPPAATPVPTLSQWAIWLAGLGILGIAGWHRRRHSSS